MIFCVNKGFCKLKNHRKINIQPSNISEFYLVNRNAIKKSRREWLQTKATNYIEYSSKQIVWVSSNITRLIELERVNAIWS